MSNTGSTLPAFRLIQEDLDKVETELRSRIDSEASIFPEIARYALFAGGKRVRPALFLLSLRMCGGEESALIREASAVAAVFELIHAASILHDDVIDEAELRRGRTAVNAYWGNKKTILLGDYLFLKGIGTIVESGHEKILPVILETIVAMIEGEGREVDLKHRLDVTEDDCIEISKLKTAILFANSTRLGSVLAGATQAQSDALFTFGMNLGIAFQLKDDILDYTSDEKTMGKPVFNDFEEGKPTVPLVQAYTLADADDQAFLRDVFADKTADRAAAKERVLAILQKHAAFKYTENLGDRLMREAAQGLDIFPDSAAKSALFDIADFVLARDH